MKPALTIVKKPQPSEVPSQFTVQIAGQDDLRFVDQIIDLIALSAKERGTGRGKREPQELIEKINKGQAIIAITADTEELAGFCYVESYEKGKFFANSALIVAHGYRGAGLARLIKLHAFKLGRELFPQATPITITTSTAVMKLNQELGYKPVAFDEITKDDSFWKGCKGCVNFSILKSKKRKNCLCTAMKGTSAVDEELTMINLKSKRTSSKMNVKSVVLPFNRTFEL